MPTDLRGLGVSAGVAAGAVARMGDPPAVPDTVRPDPDPDVELDAARQALETVAASLDRRAARADRQAAGVLTAQALMARDPALARTVEVAIRDGAAAVTAVADAFGAYRATLAAAGGYMADRVADLDDVCHRTVAVLLGVPMPGVPDPGHPYVLVAHDLAPADTTSLDAGTVLAVVTETGGPTSHTAILAKALGVPAVVACPEASRLGDGDQVLVDGSTGAVTLDPSEPAVRRALADHEASRDAHEQAAGPGRTADGHPVPLLVNLGGAADLVGLDAVAAVEAEGVGLFRTEFLYLDRADAPSHAEQVEAYRRVFTAFAGRRVVVRTLDAGADKPLPFVTGPDEANPALGVRGLRTARRHPDLLAVQLAALAEAAKGSGADVEVMAPMVATPGEAAGFVAQAHDAGLPTAGVMVEIPAAALRARHVVAACDFVSLGTNDLAQYTYAADRSEGLLAELLDAWQPAVLELVRLTAEAGTGAGTPVGVCGEAASDPMLALVLVGLGVTSLSMTPRSVPSVRTALGLHSLAECRGLASRALEARDGRDGRTAVGAAAARA
ncbi:MAG: phosphoenolpyruvate--protein phosphotransferase [Actinomycetes bacterium]